MGLDKRGVWFHAERVPEENAFPSESAHRFWLRTQRIELVSLLRWQKTLDRLALCIGEIDLTLVSKHEIRIVVQPLEGVVS